MENHREKMLVQEILKRAYERQISMFDTNIIGTSFNWIKIITIFNFLTQMSEEDKKCWSFDFSTNNDPNDGFLPGRNGDLHDQKYVFHASPRALQKAQDQNAPFADHPDIVWFSETLKKYHEYFYVFFQKIMVEHDTRLLPGYDFLNQIPQDPNDAVVIRLLKYPKGMEVKNKVLAKAHYDRSFATIHITETAPGLFLGNNLSIPFKSQPDKFAFFFSAKAAAITGGTILYKKSVSGNQVKYSIDSVKGGLLNPTKHVVLSSEETLINERFSIVVFLHTKDELPKPTIDTVIG